MNDPVRHRRRSIRLKGWDYAGAGAYFITICTHHHQELFGVVINGEMQLNELGRIAMEEWQRSAIIRAEIQLDAWVVMPNHLHGLVFIQPAAGAHGRAPLPMAGDDVGPVGDTSGRAPLPMAGDDGGPAGDTSGRARLLLAVGSAQNPPGRAPKSLGSFVAGYKSAVTKRINAIRQTPGVPVWQRNYFEHIARNDQALNAIRAYIQRNPWQWALDRDNAANARRAPVP